MNDNELYELSIDVNLIDIPQIDESNIEVRNRLGSGQFGDVYHGIYNSVEIALKVDSFFMFFSKIQNQTFFFKTFILIHNYSIINIKI